MKMRCRKATKQIGPYIDGELTVTQTRELREHLEACEGCSRRLAYMSGLVGELRSLPVIIPTPEESYRLANRLRREMAGTTARGPAFRRGQWAAAAISVLALFTVAVIGLAVWNGGGPAPVAEEAAPEGESTLQSREGQLPVEGVAADGTTTDAMAAAAVARPALVTTGNDYTAADLDDFRNDLGARLDFYSTYWYPASGGTSNTAALRSLQAELAVDLTEQAAAAGHDPEELMRALESVMDHAGDEILLPCYAERARIEGKDAWLISVSGPEDYLLFPDRKKPPAMALASLGGEESLKISESVLRELAAWLAPSKQGSMPLAPVDTVQDQKKETREEETFGGDTASLPGEGGEETPAGEEPAPADEDFQSFLRRLAAQGTSLDVISALRGLNYEQILLLLQGDWSALAADGVNLSDFLVPPKRLWAVDCSSGAVIW